MRLNWEDTIMKIVYSSGGEVDLQFIYKKIPELIDLTSEHLKETQWGGRPAFQHIVRSYISNLCQAGRLINISRGRYRLNDFK